MSFSAKRSRLGRRGKLLIIYGLNMLKRSPQKRILQNSLLLSLFTWEPYYRRQYLDMMPGRV